MPPRKKPDPAATAKHHAAELAAAKEAEAALAQKVSDLQAKWQAGLLEIQGAADKRWGTQSALAVDTAKRLAALEKGITEIHERAKNHEIAGATRRASVAGRIAALERQGADFERTTKACASLLAGNSEVDDEALSNTLRNLWLTLAGMGAVLVTVGIKVFTS